MHVLSGATYATYIACTHRHLEMLCDQTCSWLHQNENLCRCHMHAISIQSSVYYMDSCKITRGITILQSLNYELVCLYVGMNTNPNGIKDNYSII